MGVLDDSFGELERQATDAVEAKAIDALGAVRRELQLACEETSQVRLDGPVPMATATERLAQIVRAHAKDLRDTHAIVIGDVHRLLRDHGGDLATDRWADLASALRERLARRDADVARLEALVEERDATVRLLRDYLRRRSTRNDLQVAREAIERYGVPPPGEGTHPLQGHRDSMG